MNQTTYCRPSVAASPRTQILATMLMMAFAEPLWGAAPEAAKKPKTFIDYFQPMPIGGSLSRDVWGAAEVGPRRTSRTGWKTPR